MRKLEIWTSCSHWGMFFEREASWDRIDVLQGQMCCRKTWGVEVNA